MSPPFVGEALDPYGKHEQFTAMFGYGVVEETTTPKTIDRVNCL